MLELTRNVWDGSDYVPSSWETWLQDAQGELWVAELDGRVVGLQHAALQPDASVWLEGIRVDEEVQGRGIGSVLLRHAVDWSRKMGVRAIRLSTYSENQASNAMAERQGLRLVGTFSAMTARADNSASGWPSQTRLAMPWESSEILQFLEHSGWQPFSGCYSEGWTAYVLSRDRLRLLLSMHAVLLAGDAEIEAVAIASSAIKRSAIRLGLLTGSSDGCQSLCRRLRSQASELGLREVRATLELDRELQQVVLDEGFAIGDGCMLLRELRLDE